MTEALTLTAHAGLVVQPYRDDQNRPRWVFRCWGTDTCDGWLALDHTSEQSAGRALVSHIAEFHTAAVTATEVKIRITGGLTERQRTEVAEIVRDAVRRADRTGQVGR